MSMMMMTFHTVLTVVMLVVVWLGCRVVLARMRMPARVRMFTRTSVSARV